MIFVLAFSSILGNSYYGESNINFLRESKLALTIFRVLVCVAVVGGAIGSIDLVWSLADLFMAFMATINLIALIPLAKIAMKLMKNYTDQKKQGLDPVFSRDDIPEAKNVSEWDGSDPLTVRQPAEHS